MRVFLLIFIVAALGNHYWQAYKAEKIAIKLAEYQFTNGPGVCEVNNILLGVECRPMTNEEARAKQRVQLAEEEAEAVQRWNDRVAEAQARKVVEQQIEDVLIYGK
ncbi:hypothetical protein [Aeromonas salmonicida]|uniref:hypothetical protein n=1 Tax=Aeromonas salmonicida TaxID=645 RepID=UPI00223FCAA4|nr:hypothetical protein [Aeromonas salmonicida]